MKSLIIILAALLVCICGCSKQSTENGDILLLSDILVQNNEITGWTYSGSGWTANNLSELTTYINGAAEIYQRYGFEEAAHQTYSGIIDSQERLLGITIYKMNTESNASATFQDPDIGLTGATDWENGAGLDAHFIRFGGFSQILTFYRGNYFIYLELNYDTEESLNIMKQFALNIDGKL